VVAGALGAFLGKALDFAGRRRKSVADEHRELREAINQDRAALREELARLTTELARMQLQINELSDRNFELKRQNLALEDQLGDAARDRERLAQEIEHLRAQVRQLQNGGQHR